MTKIHIHSSLMKQRNKDTKVATLCGFGSSSNEKDLCQLCLDAFAHSKSVDSVEDILLTLKRLLFDSELNDNNAIVDAVFELRYAKKNNTKTISVLEKRIETIKELVTAFDAQPWHKRALLFLRDSRFLSKDILKV